MNHSAKVKREGRQKGGFGWKNWRLWLRARRIRRSGAVMLPLIFAASAGTQEPAPCDPAATPCLTTDAYVLVLRAFTQGEEPRNLAGGRGQAELRYRGWRVGGRLDGTAISGEYRSGDLSTVRTVEAHVSVAWDVLRLPQGITVGPAIAAGGAVSLESRDGIRASLPRAVTAVVGARLSWPGGWIIGGAGAVQEFGRGVGAKATWSIRTSDRTAHIGTFSYGRRLVPAVLGAEGEVLAGARSEGAYFAWLGESVRF